MKSLIINSPYVRPARHWVEPRPNTPLDRVNEIRSRLEAWQAAGRPGLTVKERLQVLLCEERPSRISRFLPLEWVEAVNRVGGFGQWSAAVSFEPSDISGLLAKKTDGT
jgi:hypothetical protein